MTSSNSDGYRSSKHTPQKQQSLEAYLNLNMVLFKMIARKHPDWNMPPYCFIDLNAGPGQDTDGQDGSPLIFCRLAGEHGIKYRAHFYEREHDHAETLQKHLDLGNYTDAIVHPQDHYVLLNETIVRGGIQFGAIYSDPSNAAPPWDVLTVLSAKVPRMDILINLACASYKRQVELPNYVHLDKRILDLKKYWFVRKPIGKHQWSILFGTNWNDYPGEMVNQGFYSTKKEPGLSIFKRLVYTNDERGGDQQLGLF
jgi:hypothetical protein